MFYLAQVLGTIALVFLISSFQKNNKDKLLKYQIFSSLFFALQYLCLNAITGCLMNFMTLIRNIIFKNYKDNIPILYLIISIMFMCLLSIFSYDGLISLLPMMAVVIYSIVLWQKNLTVTRMGEVISCILFMIYNINVLAIAGLISTILELVFVLHSIYKFDIKRNVN